MEALMWAVVVLLGLCLLLVSIWGLFVGIITLVTDQELQRCRHCGRYGLAARGQLHAESCPPAMAHHLPHLWSPTLHLHHH